MPTAKVSAKGWVVIPAEYRKKHHIQPGDKVQVVDYGEVIAVVPVVREPEATGYGMLQGRYYEATVTLNEVASDGNRTERAGLTVLVRDLPDTADRIRREFHVPTATLTAGHPKRVDEIVDADGAKWTIV